MANFHTHVSFSSFIGCGYAGAGWVALGVPLETALLGGGLCGISGMLPDLDSDSGIPLRESMAFAAAVMPMLALERFQEFHLSYDQTVLVAALSYFLVRFGVARVIAAFSVHRGMFHSIPAGLIFAGMTFLVSCGGSFYVRYYKAGGVFIGFLSHLVLDEIYSIEWKRGRWRFKSSWGTALKWWGKHPWANFSTYLKLGIVMMMVFNDPMVFHKLERRFPTLAQTVDKYQNYIPANPFQYRNQQYYLAEQPEPDTNVVEPR